jgi:hypothetical protein
MSLLPFGMSSRLACTKPRTGTSVETE